MVPVPLSSAVPVSSAGPVSSVLAARSIAIVGASERGRWPAQIIENLRTHGYAGRVYLVNPRQTEVFGERCYPSLRDLPEPVEHAAIIVPSAACAAVLEDAEARRRRVGDGLCRRHGRRRRSRIARARVAGSRHFWPARSCASPVPTAWAPSAIARGCSPIPTASCASCRRGRSASCSSPAAICSSSCRSAADRGLRFSYGISTGNEPDIGLEDYPRLRRRRSRDDDDRAVHRGHPPAGCVHGGGRQGAGRRQADHRDQDRAVSRLAGRGRSRTPARSPATTRRSSRCASATASSTCRNMDDMVETTLAFQCGRRPKGPRSAS